MSKLLVSWMAFNHDFQEREVNEAGPTIGYHSYFWEHDEHILLYSHEDHLSKLEFLENYLRRRFPDHTLRTQLIPLDDVIDLKEVKAKVERFLLDNREHEMDIFFSPGTSIMQLAWALCHSSLGLKTRLIQTREARHSRTKKPEQIFLDLEKDALISSIQIREGALGKKNWTKKHHKTQSIIPMYEKADKVAATDHVSVLIKGASGTGKEHLAHYIHQQSPRKNQVFRAVNCAAFADNLLSSQLFGHLKGAFTDAHEDKKGLFEVCNGGTLFLDEIGDISPFMQQSLLRVLQEGEIWPLGASKARKVDVRIICASNRDIPQRCKEGIYRWDLYYRLAVVELELPSLYDRGIREIEEMIQFFLKEKKTLFGRKSSLKLAKAAKEQLLSYPWPGNIRELENVIEELYVFCEDKVKAEDLPARISQIEAQHSEKWKDIEALHLEKLYKRYKGQKSTILEAVGYGSINTLKKKLEEYGIGLGEEI